METTYLCCNLWTRAWWLYFKHFSLSTLIFFGSKSYWRFISSHPQPRLWIVAMSRYVDCFLASWLNICKYSSSIGWIHYLSWDLYYLDSIFCYSKWSTFNAIQTWITKVTKWLFRYEGLSWDLLWIHLPLSMISSPLEIRYLLLLLG